MVNAQNSIVYIILGSFLALVTSVILEILKIWMTSKNNRKDFDIILKAELKNIISAIDRLIDNYSKNQFYSFVILEELKEKVSRIEKTRDKISLVKNEIKKEEILSLINEIYIFYSDTKILENIAFNRLPNDAIEAINIWNADIYKSQRQMVAIKSIDLKRKIQNLVAYLESK